MVDGCDCVLTLWSLYYFAINVYKGRDGWPCESLYYFAKYEYSQGWMAV
jgi:hypothetical protein